MELRKKIGKLTHGLENSTCELPKECDLTVSGCASCVADAIYALLSTAGPDEPALKKWAETHGYVKLAVCSYCKKAIASGEEEFCPRCGSSVHHACTIEVITGYEEIHQSVTCHDFGDRAITARVCKQCRRPTEKVW